MIEKFLSPVSKEIWFILDYPEDWMFRARPYNDVSNYTIVHKQTQIGLWVANGPILLSGDESSVYKPNSCERDFTTKTPKIGIFDRWILWYKVKRVIKFLNNSITDPVLEELRKFNESKRG